MKTIYKILSLILLVAIIFPYGNKTYAEDNLHWFLNSKLLNFYATSFIKSM